MFDGGVLLRIPSANRQPLPLITQFFELLGQSSLARKAALDVDGIRAVLELRSRFAPSPPPSTDPTRYYDLSYYEKALAR